MKKRKVLVCEDEPFIALDLAEAVEEAGGEVVGPAASVRQAMELLARTPVDGAILDVNLVDRDVLPVVEYLRARNVPMVIQTGGGLPDGFKRDQNALPVFGKPVAPSILLKHLAEGMT